MLHPSQDEIPINNPSTLTRSCRASSNTTTTHPPGSQKRLVPTTVLLQCGDGRCPAPNRTGNLVHKLVHRTHQTQARGSYWYNVEPCQTYSLSPPCPCKANLHVLLQWLPFPRVFSGVECQSEPAPSACPAPPQQPAGASPNFCTSFPSSPSSSTSPIPMGSARLCTPHTPTSSALVVFFFAGHSLRLSHAAAHDLEKTRIVTLDDARRGHRPQKTSPLLHLWPDTPLARHRLRRHQRKSPCRADRHLMLPLTSQISEFQGATNPSQPTR